MAIDFSELTEAEQLEQSKLLFADLHSAEELRDWAKYFLNLELPHYTTDPESTSNPLDAIWQVYNTFKNNSGDVNPGYIWLSARECLKCQVKGTKILLQDRWKNIEDVCIGDTIWTGFSWQKVTNTFDEGSKTAIRINVDGGFKATGTPIHRYWSLRDGKEQWITSQDLNQETDLICINVNTPLKDSKVLDLEKYEIGYFLGLLIGDGCLTILKQRNSICLAAMDTYIRSFFCYFVKKYLYDAHVYKHTNGRHLTVTSKKATDTLKEWGIKPLYSWEKTIPSFVYTNIDVMKGFIAGVFDTDGCWDKMGDSFFEMTSPILLEQMQVALASLGIESRVRHNTKLYGMQKHLVSRLTIGQTESAKFEQLGILFKSEKAQYFKPIKGCNKHDSIPYSQLKVFFETCKKYSQLCKIHHRKHKKPNPRYGNKGMTPSILHKYISWMKENHRHGKVADGDMEIIYSTEKIIQNKWKTFTKEKIEEQYFHDLTVENEHSYWSNGLISHNTVAVSVLETLLLLRGLECGTASATEDQSAVALGYINGFLLRIAPLMKAAGWESTTNNKRLFKYKMPNGKHAFIKIVICSMRGMNGLHSNILCVAEDQRILIKNSSIEQDEQWSNVHASDVYDMFKNGENPIAITFNHKNGGLEEKPIMAAYESQKELLKITTSNGKVLRVSPEHRLFACYGYVDADQVEVGDDLLELKNGEVQQTEVLSIEKEVQERCIDFTVADNNNFFANNILVHNCLDELDLADPKAVKEGINITGYSKGIHGVKLFLSTLKFNSGPMSAALESADDMGYKVLRWNIIDVTERCPPERHLPNGPRQPLYIQKDLPLKTLTPEEYDLIPRVEQTKFELIENVYEGCSKCPLLAVCKTRLAHKPADAVGGFYKPIQSVIQKFKENDPDTASSQLMCWRVGTTGLVYSRFSSTVGTGNVITLKQAYEDLFGPTSKPINELTLLNDMREIGISFYAGVDWGYTHDFTICITALLPTGDVWLMETYASPGLEFSEQLEIAITFREKYGILKWFVDQAMPSSIKTFNKNGMRCPKFVKDVLGGIEAMRSKIMNASGKRLFKIIQNDSNKKTITALQKHRFLVDGQGNPTVNPDDERGIADIADNLRYIAQNMWPVKGTSKPHAVWVDSTGKRIDPNSEEAKEIAAKASVHENQMKAQIASMVGSEQISVTTKRKGSFFFSF